MYRHERAFYLIFGPILLALFVFLKGHINPAIPPTGPWIFLVGNTLLPGIGFIVYGLLPHRKLKELRRQYPYTYGQSMLRLW